LSNNNTCKLLLALSSQTFVASLILRQVTVPTQHSTAHHVLNNKH